MALPFLGTLLGKFLLGLGVASTIKGNIDAKKQYKAEKKRLAQQQVEAKEQAALVDVREDDSAEIVLGADDDITGLGTDPPKRKKRGRTSAGIGGLSTSRVGGLL